MIFRSQSAWAALTGLCIALAASLTAFGPVHAQEASQPAERDISSSGNLFLADYGTRVVAFSSEYGSGWEVANLTPMRSEVTEGSAVIRPLIWSSAPDAPFPHWLLYEFDRPRWITSLVFDNYLEEEPDHPGISAREVEIWGGATPEQMVRLQTVKLTRNQPRQQVTLPPSEVRFVKLVITSNYGHPWYTELNATAAFDDGNRPSNGGGADMPEATAAR